MDKQERQSNIELLRILLMLGVIVLHYNGVGGLQNARGINYFVLMVFESLFICAVDLFMLISGYFSCRSSKIVVQKPVRLILQVIIISAAFYIVTSVFKKSFSIKSFAGSLVPANYFVILYVTVYFLSPYLNIIYEKMNTKLIAILMILFAVYPTMVEFSEQLTKKTLNGLSSIGLDGSQAGYTIVNFILMYLVGMYIRKYFNKLKNITRCRLVLVFGLACMVNAAWSLVTVYLESPANLAWEYCNPIVIIEAAAIFLLFLRLNIGYVKWINRLSQACFTVYLTHSYFIPHIKVDWAVKQSPLVLIIHMIISAVVIFLIGYCVYVVYEKVMRIILKRFDSKKLVITEL